MRLTLFIRRSFGASALAASLLLASCGGPRSAPTDSAGMAFDDTVAVGILHSLSGTMAISESTLSEVEKMAIE
ncbi:MAG: transporter substrate-binding protein, partial [Synechococcus sp. SB0666_bin_14]|nr:transporter substrate-binding protein [Synechococcus sp. SB0666_bin_14]